MQFRLIAKVAIEKVGYHFDKEYTYLIPKELENDVVKGCRIIVPFGNGNATRQGIVLSIEPLNENVGGIKSIVAVLDEAPLINDELLNMAKTMKDIYFCTYYEAFKVILPIGMNFKFIELYSANVKCIEPLERHSIENNIIEYLNKHKKPVKRDKLIKDLNLHNNIKLIANMVNLGYIKTHKESVRKVNDAKLKMVCLKSTNLFNDNIKLSKKQREVCELLQSEGATSAKDLCYVLNISESVIKSLLNKGIVNEFEKEIYRNPINDKLYNFNIENIILNEEQRKVYNSLHNDYIKGDAVVSLLYGVTGSGKTSVFMKLVDDVYKDKKGIIVMVPEISLTPKLIELFKSRYGESVAVFHSSLSLGERLDEWKRVNNGLATIVIGTRSAVFAPLKNIGLIVLDEEHEYTYKSDFSPRFHAKDIANIRINYHKGLLVLCSATPLIEDYYKANNGKYSLYKLSSRYGGATLPAVEVVDMNSEREKGNHSLFSSRLIQELHNNVINGNQSILLLNRRGYNTFVSCRMCGNVVACPNCSVSMTYHRINNKLICHYCGYSVNYIEECPVCHERELSYKGLGTQRIEEELKTIIPSSRVLRLDADSTTEKFFYEKELKSFSRGEYDIMIGTQMVAKGLDFPNVKTVGVLLADQSLYNQDYRSYEKTFSLLTQVVGRAGRGKLKGKAIIQTFTPENSIISLAASQNYDKFYEDELKMRKVLLYPPFADICIVGFVCSEEIKTVCASKEFFNMFKKNAMRDYKNLPLRILGPSPASIVKINDKYRYKIIIKFRNSKMFRQLMSETIIIFNKDKRFKGVSVFVDINPDRIM